MESKPDNNKTDQEYALGYDSVITTQMHGSRTAEKQAGWFLPYLKPGISLLDCGCGQGTITVGLAKAVEPGHVTGIDVSETVIQRARDKATEMKIENVSFDVGNICQLDFSDNSFDAVFSHNVLEHIPEPSEALQEIHRVLKPGGVVGIRDCDWGGYIFEPDDEKLFEWSVKVLEADWKNLGGYPRIGRHLRRLLHESGFVEVAMSASYDNIGGDPESLKLIDQVWSDLITQPDFVARVTRAGLAKAEELEATKKYMQIWKGLPGAFFALTHCEAIGRKPR